MPEQAACLSRLLQKNMQKERGGETVPDQSVKHIFICGAKSLGQYGGFETFVDKLAEQMQAHGNIKLHIACKANGSGCMDETKLQGVRHISDAEFEYRGARCFKITVPPIGPAVAIWYDLAAIASCLKYCREQSIAAPVFYVLACRIGPWIGGIHRRVQKLGGRLLVNPDGHEWLRGKWPLPVKLYWKVSEKLTVKHADLLVCDSLQIEKYIHDEYAAYHPQTTYIAYGADERPSDLPDDAPQYVNWLRERGLTPGGYCLAVGRFVPENNYEIMIREWMRSRTKKPLVLITNRTEQQLRKLEERVPFQKDPRIKLAGAVYDQQLLKKIRENAFASVHGHEVGGTNPSLLEGLQSTGLNLLLDVSFNREVAGDAALYWTKEEGSLAALAEKMDQMTAEEREQYAAAARGRVREAYTWPRIAGQYMELFTK